MNCRRRTAKRTRHRRPSAPDQCRRHAARGGTPAALPERAREARRLVVCAPAAAASAAAADPAALVCPGTVYLIYDAKEASPPYFARIELARSKAAEDDLKMLYNMLLVGGEMRAPPAAAAFYARPGGAAARGAEAATAPDGGVALTKRSNAQYALPAAWRTVDFIVAGAQKGGTTALALNVQKHPDIYMDPAKDPRKSEPHFFDIHWTKGLAHYKKGFDYSNARVGEKTPDLLYLPHTFPLIQAVNPHAKLIVVLREPVARAHSAWRMEAGRGGDARSFRAAVADELAHKLGEIRTFYTSQRHYMQRGLYCAQLAELLRWFPRQNLLVLFSEKVKADMAGQYARVYEFLDLPPLAKGEEKKYALEFEGAAEGPEEGVSPALRAKLRRFFKSDIQRLEALLGEETGWL